MTAIALLGTGGALLGLVFPLLTGILMDSIIPEAAYGRLLQIFLIMLSCAIASALFDVTKKVALLRVETMSDISMQAALWDRLMSLPAAFFRRFSSGDLAMRSLGINTIRQIVSGVTVNTILASLFSIFNFILLFYYDWEMALVALGLALIGILFVGTMGLRKVRHQRVMNEIQGKISGAVLQFITGIAKLRVSGTETRAFAEWARMFEGQKRSAYRAGLIQGAIETFQSTFPVLASMTIFAWMIFGEVSTLTTGDFVAFNAAYASFQNALLQMAVALTASLNVVPLYERLEPILQEPPEVDATRAHPGELTGAIEVNHVVFRYAEGGPLVVQDVSFTVRPGEFIALVGPSGSGKSTMLRLLLGFESPESGSLYYDGQDLSTLDVREVRRQTGVVLQNARVMPGDIFQNIVGASHLTLDDAWEAARNAGLEEDIRSMPMGMNTVVSAGGETLSGGQRQRLLIARAIVKKPRILFFDEATSALDNKTQAIVSRCLEGLKSTRVIIAHRLSTVIHADRIMVMESGRLVESGSYEELMKKNGVFAELAKRQLS
jgi:ATP-binding cassette subfamily C protein